MNSADVGKPRYYIKRKRKVLSILEKVQVLRKLELGFNIKYLGQEYGVGNSTIYDIKLRREEILKYYAESFSLETMECRKKLHKGKSCALDRVLYKWFRELRNKGVAVSRRMLMDKAKALHAEMNIKEDCDYSEEWLQKFQLSYGIRNLQPSAQRGLSECEVSFLENAGDHSKVDRLCRLCLVELNDFTPIYEFDDFHRFNVADAINDLLGMDLNPDDGYPTKICSACLEEVAHFRRFKGKCFESKAKLKDMIDEKDYYADLMESGDEDGISEAERNEANEIPVPSEVEEVTPLSGEVNMIETHMKCEIVGSDEEEEMEDIDSIGKEIGVFLDSNQSRLTGESQEESMNSSECVGRTVKKQYLIFCQPVIASDKGDDALESSATVSASGPKRKRQTTKKSGSPSASSSVSPKANNRGSVPVKCQVPSNDGNCGNQRKYLRKGGKLVS